MKLSISYNPQSIGNINQPSNIRDIKFQENVFAICFNVVFANN